MPSLGVQGAHARDLSERPEDEGQLSDTGTYTIETSGYRPRRPVDYHDDLLWDSGFGKRPQRRGFVSDSDDEERKQVIVGKRRRRTVPSSNPSESKKDRGESRLSPLSRLLYHYWLDAGSSSSFLQV